MLSLFLTIAFWVIAAYAFYAGEDRRVPLVCAAIWLAAFAAPFVVPSLFTLSVIVRYALPVVLAIWLKVQDAL